MDRNAIGGPPPYPIRARQVITLTLLINIAFLAIRLVSAVMAIDPHRRYEMIAGSSLPGTSIIAKILLTYGVAILFLIAIALMIWRDYESTGATVYAVAMFVAIPFIGARYIGRASAGFPASPSLYALTALWLGVCGIIALVFTRRLAKFERGGRMAMVHAIADSE